MAAVLLLLVSIPLGLFALVGLPHLFRTPLVRVVVARGAGGEPPTVASAHFAPAFALLTGTALTGGNAVEVLANGDATFPLLWRDLRSARRSVTVQMYYAGPGAVADSVIRILAERARTGVDVYFLYDAFGAQELPQRYLDTLRAAGARVAEFRPVRWYALGVPRASWRACCRSPGFSTRFSRVALSTPVPGDPLDAKSLRLAVLVERVSPAVDRALPDQSAPAPGVGHLSSEPREKTLTGGAPFLGLYAVFMVALPWSAPEYIEQVWNLPALSGVLVYGIPLEKCLFGAAFGLYWSGVYEHFTWTESVAHADKVIVS